MNPPIGQPRTIVCAECGRKATRYTHKARYCGLKCKRRARRVRERAQIRAYRTARRNRSVGRVCAWCQATDAETRWSNAQTECQACYRARERLDCPKCGAPVSLVTARSWCVQCDPRPAGAHEVILLDSGSDRERKVWRTGRGTNGNWIRVGCRGLYARKRGPHVMVLPTSVWLRTRR